MRRKNYIHQLAAMLLMLMAGILPTWGIFNPVDHHLYPDNMTMTIQLKNGEQTIDTCEVAAFIDGECREAVRAQKGLYYLVIVGEGGGQKVEIRTCINDEIVTIDNSIVYISDQNIGTPWEPYIIDISAVISGTGKKGDCNGDGTVDVADIATVISVMAEGEQADPVSVRAADVNGDGNVDVADIANVIDIMSANSRRF